MFTAKVNIEESETKRQSITDYNTFNSYNSVSENWPWRKWQIWAHYPVSKPMDNNSGCTDNMLAKLLDTILESHRY